MSTSRPTVERLGHAVAALDPFRLAGLSPLVTIGGSLVAALAVARGRDQSTEAWEAVSLDERWQLEQWGADAEARGGAGERRRDFLGYARFLEASSVRCPATRSRTKGTMPIWRPRLSRSAATMREPRRGIRRYRG